MESELLAPAKNKEIAIEAINCGADAVYIGAPSFGARANASNTIEDIKEVVKYAHKFWAKVFVTVNTILTDNELEHAVNMIKDLDKIGVDAIIIQDFGLLKQLKDLKLSIQIHMSTQCDNRDIEKISFFNKIGIPRVVLARELSLEKIKKIHNENPNIELEAFMHGALCVSYSGQCYLSQYIGGRSANRGECAQPCRKKYDIINKEGKIIAKNINALCLKDFNASSHIEEMLKSGIYSFKIEGRLKDKNYVKNITAFYRQELDKYSKKSSSGKSIIDFIPNPEKSFNRGFTDYFLKKRKDCFNFISPKSRGELIGIVRFIDKNYFIIETDKTLNPQDGLCYECENNLEGFLINKTEQKNSNQICIYPNHKINIKKGQKIYRNIDTAFEKELEKSVKRQIGVNIIVNNNSINITDENNISITIDFDSKETAKNQNKMNETFIKQFSKTGESDFYINSIKIDSDIPFIPISEINNLRRKSFDKLMQKRLNEYKRKSQKELKFAPYYKNNVDYRANVHNKKAEDFYRECNCNVEEWSMESSSPERSIELMRTKHCIKYALNMCKSPDALYLADEFNKKYPLKFDCKNCEMIVMSK